MKGNETSKRYRFLWVALSLYLCLMASFKAYAFFAITDDGAGNTVIRVGPTSIKLNGNTARENFPLTCCGGVTFSEESDAVYTDDPAQSEEDWN